MMKTTERGEIQVRAEFSGVELHIHHLERLVNRTVICMIGSVLILGLAFYYLAFRLGE